jgi:hypothetical protein
MSEYYTSTCTYLDNQGISYRQMDDHTLSITYNCDNVPSVRVVVIFDKDGDPLVALRVWSIAKVKEEKMPQALVACNDLNNKFRWVKFTVDSDLEFSAQMDAHVDAYSCGEEVLSLVRRTVNIVDDAYPELMKVIWG